jgi:hypothetical protein
MIRLNVRKVGSIRTRVLGWLLALGLALSLAAPALADSGSGGGSGGGGNSSPDFALSANYGGAAWVGHLVRGGLSSCPNCTTAIEPRYVNNDPFGCFYDSNSISVTSLNDFQGTVTLQILNLPAGVTSQTATTLNVPRRGSTSTPLKLQAASNAALGAATITMRATSGSIVHTLDLPISVGAQLPRCQ